MQLRFSVLPVFSLVFATAATSVFASAALPRVDVARSVSARAMYGEAPAAPKQVIENKAQNTTTREPVARVAIPQPQTTSLDILTPRRPSENLWAQPKDAPLRMPRASEFAMLDSGFSLPEESLSIRAAAPVQEAPKKIALRPAPPPQKIVEKVIDEDAIAKAYEAGRIAELQRIADRALADRGKESKTRKLVVPMDETPKPNIAAVRSVKTSPVREEEFAYKNSDDIPLTKLSPMQLKRAFKKTYVSENKHLSAYKAQDKFDSIEDIDFSSAIQGFDSTRDLSEGGDIRPLEIKLSFRGSDSALSRDNYMLLSEYAGIVVSNPKRAIQVSIPEHATRSFDGRKLAARRLAIIEQVLRDTGVSDYRIVPVLADRSDDALVLRVISNEMFQSLTQKRGKQTVTNRSLAW